MVVLFVLMITQSYSMDGAFLFCPQTVFAGTTYDSYSNVKKEWYFRRNKEHKAPEGAATYKELKKYHAYYYDYHTDEKVLYLTFDCGYENGFTSKILDILKKHDVKAIFFVTKHFVQTNPKLCMRMKKEGHLVGNHTLNHPSLPSRSVSQIKNEVKGLEELFLKKTGYELDKYFRPPMGEYSNRVLKLLSDMEYTTIFWSLAYGDYDPAKQPGKQYVIDQFQNYNHKGAIALMHNISKSNADALNEVIISLKKNHYRCARIDELGEKTDLYVAKPIWGAACFGEGEQTQDSVMLRFYTKNKKDLEPEGFEIYRKEKGGSYQLVATKKANKKASYQWKDCNVKPNTIYYYKVKSYCNKYGRKYVTSGHPLEIKNCT